MQLKDLTIPLFEADIPERTYGYWITDVGEPLPVGYQNHGYFFDSFWKKNNINDPQPLHDGYSALALGWIRVQGREEATEMGVDYDHKAVTRRALFTLRRMLSLFKPESIYVDLYKPRKSTRVRAPELLAIINKDLENIRAKNQLAKQVTEAKVLNVDFMGMSGWQSQSRTIKVWQDPVASDLTRIFEFIKQKPDSSSTLRGLVPKDKPQTLYVWDAYEAIHYEVRDSLGLGICFELTLKQDRIGTEQNQAVFEYLTQHVPPSIKRAYGNTPFRIFHG